MYPRPRVYCHRVRACTFVRARRCPSKGACVRVPLPNEAFMNVMRPLLFALPPFLPARGRLYQGSSPPVPWEMQNACARYICKPVYCTPTLSSNPALILTARYRYRLAILRDDTYRRLLQRRLWSPKAAAAAVLRRGHLLLGLHHLAHLLLEVGARLALVLLDGSRHLVGELNLLLARLVDELLHRTR